MKVVFILGSEVDKPHAEKILAEIDEWGIAHELHTASAHKVPEKVFEIVKGYNEAGEAIVYITIAGRSNGLSGVVAANAVHPVIACPPFKDKEDMLLNMHSTLQMPSDTPVLMVVDPKNAATAAVRILALADEGLSAKVADKIGKIKESFN